MLPHLVFFLAALSFLSGIVYASLGLPFLLSLVPAAILLAALFASNAGFRVAIPAAMLLVLGSFYYRFDDYRYRAAVIQAPKSGELRGTIADDPKREPDAQSFILKTSYGKILIRTDAYPAYSYGDALVAEGKIEAPPDNSYGRYLAKERVTATMTNPGISKISSGGGSAVFAFLFKMKNGAKESFRKLLSPAEAALLSGITLGANEGMSKSFLENLSLSGNRHLTAVSGLHMAIMVFIIFGALIYLMPRRYAFILTFVIIGLFAALIGFSVSAVRSALMAFLAGLAREAGRRYAPYNALALAALILTIANPKVLVFDIGFELSFLAVFAIIYLAPVIRRLLRVREDSGFMNWKDSLTITIAAQLMTAPILIVQFQNFSLTAFAANVLVLLVVPYLMAFGFLMAIFSSIFYPLAAFLSLIVAPLVRYVMFVVDLCARLAVRFNPPLGFTGIVIYYGILALILFWFYRPAPRVKTMPRANDAKS